MYSNLPHENLIILHFQEKISLFSFFMVENTKNFDRKLCGHRIYQRKAYLEFDVRIWLANCTNEVVLCLHLATAAILPEYGCRDEGIHCSFFVFLEGRHLGFPPIAIHGFLPQMSSVSIKNWFEVCNETIQWNGDRNYWKRRDLFHTLNKVIG